MDLSQQMWGPNVRPEVKGNDNHRPIQWAGEPCGHKIPATIGPPLKAEYIKFDLLLDAAIIQKPNIIVVDALPGECPVCDENPQMAVRDSTTEGS